MAIYDEMNAKADVYSHNAGGLIDGLIRFVENTMHRIADRLETYRANRDRRDAFKNLLLVDQRTLSDIGLTRSDVLWASKLPLHENAACELQKIRNRRATSH